MGLNSSIRMVLLFICPNFLTYFGALKFRAPISPCLCLHIYIYICVYLIEVVVSQSVSSFIMTFVSFYNFWVKGYSTRSIAISACLLF